MIPREMTGAVLYGKEDVRLETVPVPEPGPGEVLIEIGLAMTCGTDLKVFHRGGHARMLKPPTLFGHEFAGCIARVGPEVEGWRKGQRVACHNSAPCLECFYCRKGLFSLCEDLLFLNGAFAPYIVVPRRIVQQNLYHLPHHVSYAEACLMEPLSCVLHGVDRTGISEGDVLAVVGDGAIGQMFVWALARRGHSVILCGGNDARLEIGRQLGAAHTVNYKAEADEARAVASLAHEGRGVDVVIECTGKPEVWETCLRMVRKAGKANLFGGCPRDSLVKVQTEAIHYNEIEVKGIFHTTPAHVRQALECLIRHPGELNPILDGEIPLSQLHEAFRRMDARESFKVRINPHRLE